jgi:hypothetical protein
MLYLVCSLRSEVIQVRRPLNRQGFDFLMELDPYFTLRFEDGSALLVNVVEAGVEGRLILAAADAETAEPTGTRRVPHP